MTQTELAQKSGVGLRFIRELEQGKESLRIDKVNDVLALFGQTVGPVPQKRYDAIYILQNFIGKAVEIRLRNRQHLLGHITAPLQHDGEITRWRFETKLTAQKNNIHSMVIDNADILEINLV